MKKIAAFALAAVVGFSAAACVPESAPAPPPPEEELTDNGGMISDRFDLETWLYPLWEGNTVYNETVWFAGEDAAPLLYEPEEILSVRSYGLDAVYEEGRDFVLDGTRLKRTSDSAIPLLTDAQFNPSAPPSPLLPVQNLRTGKYVYALEGSDISLRQVAVTYRHSAKLNWTLPTDCSDRFPETMKKLNAGEPVKVLFYGDSITAGANASGYLGIEPFAGSYSKLVFDYLSARFPAADLTYVNNAVGGTDSNWGAGTPSGPPFDQICPGEDHFRVRVLDEAPDLLFLAFGMNDQEYSAGVYKRNVEQMIGSVREAHPAVEIMLVAPMTANPDTAFYNKDYAAYRNALVSLAESYEGVGIADVLSVVDSVYGAGKRFQDCTANNINHPNDFMMRLYAQSILYSIFGADYIAHI